MKYRDEIHIALMALVFSCAMFAVYAVVPKDAAVAARAKATVKEAPETAAEAEALRSSQDEDAGLTSIQKTTTMTIVPILPTAPILLTARIPPIRLLMILELIIPVTPATVTLQMKALPIRAVMILQIRSIIHLMTDPKTPQLITVMMIPLRIVGILLPIPAAAILLTPQTVPLLILPPETAIIKK